MRAEAVDAFDASIWLCLDEIREVFGLQDHEGATGEWLACGFVPKSMVAAQVLLQDHGRQPDPAREILHEPEALGRRGSVCSIRSISSAEQEEHIRVQILRNKASRENLQRTKAATKRPGRGREQPLLRQAISNSQVWNFWTIWSDNTDAKQKTSTKEKHSEALNSSFDAQTPHIGPQEEGTILEAHAGLAESFARPFCYASIRSPVLREALEREEPPKPSRLDCVPRIESSRTMVMRKDWGVEERLRELSLLESCDDDHDSRDSEIEFFAQETDGSELLPHSERLRRARAGKRRADFYTLGQNPGLESGAMPEVGSDSKSDPKSNLGCMQEIVRTMLDELEQPRDRRERSAAPQPSLFDERESSSEYAPSLTDGASPTVEEVHRYEADISDNYDSASERPPLRRTRRRSAHSRLTTPLDLYDTRPEHRPTRG